MLCTTEMNWIKEYGVIATDLLSECEEEVYEREWKNNEEVRKGG